MRDNQTHENRKQWSTSKYKNKQTHEHATLLTHTIWPLSMIMHFFIYLRMTFNETTPGNLDLLFLHDTPSRQLAHVRISSCVSSQWVRGVCIWYLPTMLWSERSSIVSLHNHKDTQTCINAHKKNLWCFKIALCSVSIGCVSQCRYYFVFRWL